MWVFDTLITCFSSMITIIIIPLVFILIVFITMFKEYILQKQKKLN